MTKDTDSDNDSDSMAARAPLTGTGVHPGMVYRPATPPGIGRDGDDEDHRWKLSARFITLFRIVITILAFADVIAWIAKGGLRNHKDSRNGSVVILIVTMILVVIWNVALVVPRVPGGECLKILPTIACEIGDCVCAINRHDSQNQSFKKPKSKGEIRKKLVLEALVDVALSIPILVIASVSWRWSLPPWWSFYADDMLRHLHTFIGSFELIAAAASIFSCYRTIVFEIVLRDIDDNGSYSRISLSPDLEDRRTAGGTVSVAA